jgi:hypothetical protein
METPEEAVKQIMQDAVPGCSKDTLFRTAEATPLANVERVRKQMRRLSVEEPAPSKSTGPTTRRQAGTWASTKEKVAAIAKKAAETRGLPAKQKASGEVPEKK